MNILSGLEALAVGVPEDLRAYMAASAAKLQGQGSAIRPAVPGRPQPRGGEGGPDWPLVCDRGAAALGTALHCGAEAPVYSSRGEGPFCVFCAIPQFGPYTYCSMHACGGKAPV